MASYRTESVIGSLVPGTLICLLVVPVVLLYIFDYTLISLLTQFFAPLLWFIAWLIFGYGVLLAIFNILGYWKATKYLSLLPIVFFCFVLVAPRLLPVSEWSFNLDVAWKHNDRVVVVKNIEEQFSDQENVPLLVPLPMRYWYLSSGGGEVVVKKRDGKMSIMFYLWRGILGSPGTGVTATRCSVCSAGTSMGQSGAWGRLKRRDGDAEAAAGVDPARLA